MSDFKVVFSNEKQSIFRYTICHSLLYPIQLDSINTSIPMNERSTVESLFPSVKYLICLPSTLHLRTSLAMEQNRIAWAVFYFPSAFPLSRSLQDYTAVLLRLRIMRFVVNFLFSTIGIAMVDVTFSSRLKRSM